MSRSVMLIIAAAGVLTGADASAQAMAEMPGMTGPSKAAPDAVVAAPFGPPIADTAAFSHLVLDQLEGRFGTGGQALRWSGEAWSGTDQNRVWVKAEGAVQGGRTEDGRYELLYDRPVTAFWDVQAGVRADIDSADGRTWAALGVEGLAPYFVRIAATSYASGQGRLAFRLEASDDIRFTQKLILEPRFEANLYSRADPGRDQAAGASDIETGLRLRYEITRKLAPYIGMVYDRRLGAGAGGALGGSRLIEEARFVIGLRGWL